MVVVIIGVVNSVNQCQAWLVLGWVGKTARYVTS